MASDGCQAPDWKQSGAFPHLMHHPRTSNTESYRRSNPPSGSSAEASGQRPGASQASTGVWDGPAPRGAGAQASAANGATAATSTSTRTHVMLPGGGRMPLLGLGTYLMNSAAAVREALELGYRHIDCANFYANEEVIGEALVPFVKAGRRKEFFIVSKVYNDHHQPDLVRQSAEDSLAKLFPGAEPEDRYLDLLLMHWPDAMKPGKPGQPDTWAGDSIENRDPSVSILQTWRAIEQLAKEGSTKYVGVSNFDLATMTALCKAAEIRPVCNQIELHPQLAQRKLVGQSLRLGIVSVAYAPLGILKGDPSREHPTVQEIAKETGCPASQVLLKWNTQRGVAVIPKAQKAEHFRANWEGFFDWTLTNEQKARLDLLDSPPSGPARKVDPEWHVWDKELPIEE